MKQLTEADIKGKVRLAINEAQLNEAEFLYDADDAELDALIREKTLEALRFVHGHADASLLDSDRVIDTLFAENQTVEVGENLSATILGIGEEGQRQGVLVVLPDYYRLVRAKLLSWKKIFTDSDLCDDSEYVKQNDKYAQGTWERPALFLIKKNGQYQLEFYCAREEFEEGIELEYLSVPAVHSRIDDDEDEDDDDDVDDDGGDVFPTPSDDDDGGSGEEPVPEPVYYYEISDKLEDALIYYLAGLVLLTLNDPHADSMFNLATTQMGIQTEK